MKAFKITMLVLLSLIDIYTIYSTIGYFILGLNTPRLIGDSNTIFVGQYIMSIVFLFITLIISFLILLLAIKLRKNK